MTIEPLNDLLGDRLGRNPLGEPLYKWFHSDSWFHFMKTDTTPVRHGAVFLVEPTFEPRKMVTAVDTWILGHWHQPEPRHEWERKYGTGLLWPREGYYSPTNVQMQRGEFPSIHTTEEVITGIRRHREKTFADFYQDGEDILAHREAAEKSKRYDIIDDAVTAFGNDPGKRNGSVSFPPTRKDLNVSSNA